jgi:hypothetical protein
MLILLIAMAQISIVGALLGTVLGVRFKVLILVPALGVTLIVVAAAGWLHQQDAQSIVWAMLAVATAMQVGYLCGAIARLATSANHAPLTRPAE